MSIAVGADAFLGGLDRLGYQIETRDGFALFDFVVPLGTLIGEHVRLGLCIPGDFPLTPPPGPHISPRIGHPDQAVHPSPLGPEWEYWSRPISHWARTDRSVRTYMAHIRQLFAQR